MTQHSDLTSNIWKSRIRDTTSFPSLRVSTVELRSYIFYLVALVSVVFAGSGDSYAQIGSNVPRGDYHLSKRAFYEGDYRSAERGFIQALKSGVRIGQARWIDSVCYYTMLGEVYFHQGLLSRSLEMHELAVQVHLNNPGWLGRLRYPRIGPSNDRVQMKIGWGNRPTVMGEFPDRMSSMEGTLDLTSSFQFGGAVNPAHTRSVNAAEVARCLAVSLRRRAQLLGPTAGLSPQSSRITSSIEAITAPPGHWVTSWVEVFYGLALMSDGQTKQAIPHLTTGATAGGFDHPLTGIALLEIGKYHLRSEEYSLAIGTLQQASLAAARYRQADVVEESFRYLTDAFLGSGGKGAVPAATPAILYAESEDFFRLAAALRLGAAELAVYSNNPAGANTLLSQARAIMRRVDLLPTDLGGRLAYLDAITQYRAGNSRAAGASMSAALAYMKRGSFRRYHLSLVEALAASGRNAVSPRNAEILYSYVLREPTDVDWRTDPMESITMLLSKHTGSIERWFELLVDRKEYDKAVRVAEHLRRHRFYSTLPFGGRLLSLRWLIEGSVVMLGKTGIEQQNHLRGKYPNLAKLSRRSEQLRLKLRQSSLLPEDEDQLKEQRGLYKEWVGVSEQLENLVHEIALRREPAKLVFPPQPSLSAIKRAMNREQAVLMFVTTSKGWHAWFIRKESDEYWAIKRPKAVRRSLADLLKSIGNRDANADLSPEQLANENWKEPAQQLWQRLIGELPSNGWDGLEELVIVPDGVLWYLPFETLLVPSDQLEGVDEDSMLITQTRVRYAPVASLSVGDQQGHKSDLKTTVVGGQLFPRESSEHAREMLERLTEQMDEVEVIGKKKPVQSSKYTAGLFDRLIVWNDIRVPRKGPYKWAPAQYDRAKSNGLLGDWIEYPWGGPDQVILPGFHTAAEATLNSKSTGQEIFLAACGLMATGTRTALLSRWRTGGKAPAVLVREFAIALPENSASEAWRSAIELTRVEKLDPKTEPRVSKSDEVTEVSADHPFFWAGYMLIDTGAEPKEVIGEGADNLVGAGDEEKAAEVEEGAEKADVEDGDVEAQPLEPAEPPDVTPPAEEDEPI